MRPTAFALDSVARSRIAGTGELNASQRNQRTTGGSAGQRKRIALMTEPYTPSKYAHTRMGVLFTPRAMM